MSGPCQFPMCLAPVRRVLAGVRTSVSGRWRTSLNVFLVGTSVVNMPSAPVVEHREGRTRTGLCWAALSRHWTLGASCGRRGSAQLGILSHLDWQLVDLCSGLVSVSVTDSCRLRLLAGHVDCFSSPPRPSPLSLLLSLFSFCLSLELSVFIFVQFFS